MDIPFGSRVAELVKERPQASPSIESGAKNTISHVEINAIGGWEASHGIRQQLAPPKTVTEVNSGVNDVFLQKPR